MTDRELLEFAAKAAGLNLDQNSPNTRYRQKTDVLPEWVYWNPLTDDGDALRLAVDLGMDLQLEGEMNSPHAVSVCEMKSGAFAREALSNDRRSSTRRAIVRTAAEIGKAKP
jgi:hypothetical protein